METANTTMTTMRTDPASFAASFLRLRCRRRGLRRRGGFSFTEVLFAVMILGIGFIMIAGIFPVAIGQTAASQEETIGAAAARSAVGAYSAIPYLSQLVPASGTVTRLTDDPVNVTVNSASVSVSPWSMVKGNQILPDDPRFGWVAMIKRDTTNYNGQTPSTAQLIVVPVQIRGESTFTVADITQTGSGNAAAAALMPLPVTVDLAEKSASNLPDECTVTGTYADAAAPGAVIIVGNGKVYRLGDLVAGSTNVYQLLPGNDLTFPSEVLSGANAFIVGRRYSGGTFSGPSMAIGTYVTYLPLK